MAHLGMTSPELTSVMELTAGIRKASEKNLRFRFNKIANICTVKSAPAFDTTRAG
jgi:hypothetical protein